MRRAAINQAGRSGRRRPIWSAALATILLAGACGSPSSDTASAPTGPGAERSVDPVLSTEFVLFDSGRSATLAEFVGTPMVVNLWSSWCPSCVTEMPDFEQAHQQHGDTVMFIGLNVQDDHAAAEELRRSTGVTYLLGYDDDGRFPDLLEAFGMPATAFIDATGRVVELWTGQLDVDSLTAKIDEHFAAGAPGASSVDASPEPTDGSGSADDPEAVDPAALDTPAVDSGVEAAAATADDTFDEDFLIGGGGRGFGFVPLDDPVMVGAAAATWLDPDDIVMGIVGPDGEAHAYPVDQMAYHHVANTRLAGEPFVVTY